MVNPYYVYTCKEKYYDYKQSENIIIGKNDCNGLSIEKILMKAQPLEFKDVEEKKYIHVPETGIRTFVHKLNNKKIEFKPDQIFEHLKRNRIGCSYNNKSVFWPFEKIGIKTEEGMINLEILLKKHFKNSIEMPCGIYYIYEKKDNLCDYVCVDTDAIPDVQTGKVVLKAKSYTDGTEEAHGYIINLIDLLNKTPKKEWDILIKLWVNGVAINNDKKDKTFWPFEKLRLI